MRKAVKFGGSSLADAGQFRKAGEIIRADKGRRYIVPSAPGKRFAEDIKVTDMLYACYALAEEGKDFRENLKQIARRYGAIIDGLELEISLDKEFEIIEERFLESAGIEYAASRGEYLNGVVMAAYLDYEFVDAAEVIIFDEQGTFDADATERILSARLQGCENAVIPGFYGAMPDGTIKTFPRDGSDITGALVAAAIGADVYENWKDVDGVLMANPQIVDNPKVVRSITYKELRELAYMGANVLHEDSIFPVRRKGIPINIRNTNKPEDEGTWIMEKTIQPTKYVITGIAGKKGFCSINIEKERRSSQIGFGSTVLQIFEENGLSFEHVPTGIDTMTAYIHQEEFMPRADNVVKELRKRLQPDGIEIESDLALIAVVGRNMKSTRGTAGKIFSALSHANVNLKMIDQGSSQLNIIIGVSNQDFEKAIQAIYNIFVVVRL